MRPLAPLALIALLAACGGETPVGEGPGGGGQGGTATGMGGGDTVEDPCPAPGRMVGETCLPPGVMDDGCPAGTWGQADGSCLEAGVPAGACGAGFEPDGAQGCLAVLPSEPCFVQTQMAVPGDPVCRPIMDCGAGTWGDIPVDASTIFVDQSYTGGNNDGSQATPFTEITQAIAAASGGELIAVAEGAYVANHVVDKAVTIHGVCPEKVEMLGDPFVAGPALRVPAAGSGSTLVGIRFTDLHTAQGIIIEGATDVTLDRVRVATNINGGIDVRHHPTDGPASAQIVDSLIDGNGFRGIFAWGSTVLIERTEIRDMQFYGGDQAIAVMSSSADGVPSDVTVRGSRIDGAGSAGVLALASALTLEATVVQRTVPDPAGIFGRAVIAQYLPGERATATIRQSVIEDAFNVAVFAASSDVTIEDTVIHEVHPDATADDGTLIALQPSASAPVATAASTLVLQRSRLSGGRGGGVILSGSTGEVESVVVRDIAPNAAGIFGRGIYLRADAAGTGEGSVAHVRGSVVERTHDVGVITFGSTLQLDGTVVRDTAPDVVSFGGRGLSLQYKEGLDLPSDVSVSGSLIEANGDHGVLVFGASLVMDATLVRATAINTLGAAGRGLGVQSHELTGFPGAAVVTHSSFEDNHGVGVFVAGSTLELADSAILRTGPTPAGALGRGLSAQPALAGGAPSLVTVTDSTLEDNHEFGAVARGAQVALSGCRVAGTRQVEVDGQLVYGDGLAILDDVIPGQLDVAASALTDNARAGVVYFAGGLSLGGNRIACNAIDLVDGSDNAAAEALVNLGDNQCGCPAAEGGCKWQGATVVVPSPIDEADARDDAP